MRLHMLGYATWRPRTMGEVKRKGGNGAARAWKSIEDDLVDRFLIYISLRHHVIFTIRT